MSGNDGVLKVFLGGCGGGGEEEQLGGSDCDVACAAGTLWMPRLTPCSLPVDAQWSWSLTGGLLRWLDGWGSTRSDDASSSADGNRTKV